MDEEDRYRRFARLIRRVACPASVRGGRGGGQGRALLERDEIVQRVLLILLERGDSIRDGKARAAWLIRVTRRDRDRYFRLLSREVTRNGVSWREPWAPFRDPVEEQERRARVERWMEAVRAAAERFQEPVRTVFTLRCLTDPAASWEEVSRRTGIPLAGIRAWWCRRWRDVRAALRNLGPDPRDAL